LSSDDDSEEDGVDSSIGGVIARTGGRGCGGMSVDAAELPRDCDRGRLMRLLSAEPALFRRKVRRDLESGVLGVRVREGDRDDGPDARCESMLYADVVEVFENPGPEEEGIFLMRWIGGEPVVRGCTCAAARKPSVDGKNIESRSAVTSDASPKLDPMETYWVSARGGRRVSRKSTSEDVVRWK
jgi:hypothetical protein